MTSGFKEFIPLDRTFHDLATNTDDGDQAEWQRLLGREAVIRWPDLLVEPRVILLSEAGSGKTEEVRHITRQLRAEGKQAFFLRIELLAQDFQSCFEEGTLEAFESWVASGQQGWLFLDSVDEARLHDPKDFERAIRSLGVKLRDTLQNAHIVITGRTDAWRPKTDLLLCRATLPWASPTRRVDEGSIDNGGPAIATVDETKPAPGREPFRIVALDDLHGEQVDRFATAKGVTDLKAFRNAIDRADAWTFTTRPLDLAETAAFWINHSRIGSRLELMRSSIAKRLEERDQDRAEARPISATRALRGARLIAAAATLARESAIRVPDGQQNTRGIAIKEVLTDWDDVECATLLSRPVFDEGIYGTVRFHHRSTREYLTAEWLHGLIVDDASRARIEALLFRRQYGMEVVVPTLRPILPWLAILDERILARVSRVAPEILLEGGDPSQLPIDTRRTILRRTCEQLAQPASSRSATDYAAVQRFANPDLAPEIGELLEQNAGDEDIVFFLLRLVWQGEIRELAGSAKHQALTSRAKYTRIAALRALNSVGSPADRAEVRCAFLTEGDSLRRDWVAELVRELPSDPSSVAWLLEALERATPRERYEVDSLSDALLRLVGELPLDRLAELNAGMHRLLTLPPVIERRNCEVSKRHGPLARVAAEVSLRLIKARHSAALSEATLCILRLLPIAKDYDRGLRVDGIPDLSQVVRSWSELNRALFWQCVAEERKVLGKGGKRLVDYWQVSSFGTYWGFGTDDFDSVCRDIAQRPLLDDRLVALTLAFSLYRENGRTAPWRNRLKKLASDAPELDASLRAMLRPPARGRSKWRRQEAQWKRRQAREAARAAVEVEKAKRLLGDRLEQLRYPGKPGLITNDQWYLHERMHKDDASSGKWSAGNWQSLIGVYGEPVSRAFRDGVVAYWRGHRPKLRSEGAPPNSTPRSAIFGLSGLSIEARETPAWPSTLTAADAELATRYALHELNGFPSWLPALFESHPFEVANVIRGEIAHELATESAKGDSHYVLYAASWDGHWLWDWIAPTVLPDLSRRRTNPQNLACLLSIVHGSSTGDATIARIARQKARATRNLTFAPQWFAVWVGVDPDAAIPVLAARLDGTGDATDQTAFAIRFIVALLGDRSQVSRIRNAYRTVKHMKDLYLLMHKFIREEEDIQRVGQGAFSPGLRDDAQDARNALFAFIRETPGKDAFLALLDLAKAHPSEHSRPWMTYHARNKAALDADVDAWTPGEVRKFNDTLTRTPGNHRELWYLAVDKLEALRHDIEDGDTSVATILQAVDREVDIRNFIGGWCRNRAAGRYNIPQEEELADAKRPDLRFHGVGFDGPVPVELKLADKWTGPKLVERLETQLCGDYLRDTRSNRGVFVLIRLGKKERWKMPNRFRAEGFETLIQDLRTHWTEVSDQFPGVEDIAIIGIDLTRRAISADKGKASSRRKTMKWAGTRSKAAQSSAAQKSKRRKKRGKK